MHRALLAACLFAVVGATPVSAQQVVIRWWPTFLNSPDGQAAPLAGPVQAPDNAAPICDAASPAEPLPWEPVWGVIGSHVFFAGPKEAPNGEEYHSSFSLDLDFNFWVWRTQGLYLFSDMRFWGERAEYNVTNGED